MFYTVYVAFFISGCGKSTENSQFSREAYLESETDLEIETESEKAKEENKRDAEMYVPKEEKNFTYI